MTATLLLAISAWNVGAVWFFSRWLPRHGDLRNEEQRVLLGWQPPGTVDYDLTTNEWEGWA